MADRLRWDRTDPHLPWARVSRHRLDRGDEPRPHGHDFAEWCWVESGSLVHRCAGRDEPLQAGDVRFLRPGAEHTLLPTAEGCVMVTASVPGPLFGELERRYQDHPAWPWRRPDPGAARLDPSQLAAFGLLVAGVPQDGQQRCDAEWLVAGLLRAMRGGHAAGAVPDWLAAATARMSAPRRLAAGLPELVRLCGRSAPHVSRAVRRAYGCTATDLIHRLRCQHAARELRLGTRAITDIAAECGYAHIGHFYRRFGAIFGCAPRAYRLAALAG